jgi:uncharacterized membrane protein YdjX (TVP38/TMEM64 family)
MLTFFSSAVLLPVAVYVWGSRVSFGLLWLGWFLGGLASYATGKWIGRDIVRRIVSERRLSLYEVALSTRATFWPVLLFHLMVPSELPGYIMGLMRYPLSRYIIILAIAEIPFAAGAVVLGSSFVHGQVALLAASATAGLALSVITTRYVARHYPTGNLR